MEMLPLLLNYIFFSLQVSQLSLHNDCTEVTRHHIPTSRRLHSLLRPFTFLFFSSHIYTTQVTLNEPFTSCKPFPTQTFLSKHQKLFWEWQYWQKNSCRSSMDTTHLQDAVSVESPKIPTIASRNQRHIITSQKGKLPTKAATDLASNGLKCK